VITKGAQIHYSCDYKGGKAPEAIGEINGVFYSGPRDGIRWYKHKNEPPEHFWQSQWSNGPLANFWDLTWDDTPGQYTIIAEIRNSSQGPKPTPTYCSRPQQIGDAGAMLSDWLNKLLKNGDGPSPDEAEREIARYRALLNDIANKLPGSDAEKHKRTVERWTDLADRLRGLLAPSDGKRRFAVRGIHLENATQQQRPLLLFLTELGEVQRPVGRGAMVKKKQWSLVDWTDPSHARFRGHYEGEGTTVLEAVNACFSSWDWGNSYPAGHVQFEVPVELRPVVGGAARRQMDTNGTNLTQEVIIVFQWIAIGTMLIAGFCFIFVGVPTLTSLAMGTSMLASTGASVFSIQQRWRDGLFDWKADAIDGLTIIGNLVGAGAWARGANVAMLGKGGAKVDFIFIGTRVATDAAQGILIADEKFSQLDELMHNPSFTPDERARRMLLLFSELVTVGLMTAVSFRASALEADALSTKPKHLPNDPRANVADDTLTKLTTAGEKIDTTKPPIVEGHTKDGKQKSKVQTGVAPAPVAKILTAEETAFARTYPPDRHPWKKYKIETDEIHLIDKDDFEFHATCDAGVLEITIITNHDPKTATPAFLEHFGPNFKKSEVLSAKDLYPKMYDHFRKVGNPPTRLQGLWAWTNYNDAKAKFDQLIKAGMSEDAAAKIAVLEARTFKQYHANPAIGGFTHPVVTAAKHLPENRPSALFSYTIDKADVE
jgi:hypothetical protein